MIHSTIVEQMKQERGITEQLKADDWWRWVQEVGNIRNAADVFLFFKGKLGKPLVKNVFFDRESHFFLRAFP